MTERDKKQITDEELLARYRQGSSESFVELVDRYRDELYNFLVKFLGKSALAEDVFQESFLQVHLSADRFEVNRRFRPWIYTIASNKARDALRRQSRRPTMQLTSNDESVSDAQLWDHLLREETTPADLLEKKQQEEQVRAVLNAMPDHLREILVLAYFNQLPYKEMAEILEIPVGTVKSRLHAAVAHFGKKYVQSTGDRRDGYDG